MLIAMVVLAVSSRPFVATRAAAPVNAISYQGRLLDTNGAPVSDASLEFVFRFYDAASGGTCLWESDDGATCDDPDETQTVALTDGLFSENIGSSVNPDGLSEAYPFDLVGVFEDNSNAYLEVEVNGETLSPRKQVVATPYALNAQTLDGLESADLLASAGDTATGDYDFSGAVFGGGSPLVFEGATPDAFETTFAFTDPTAANTVTFQDASGTVAFLSDISAGNWETSAFAIYENDDDVIVGTDGDETIADAGFSLSGDDLFVAGSIGTEGGLYTDGVFSTQGTVLNATGLTFVGAGLLTTAGLGADLTIGASDQIIVDGGAPAIDIRDQLTNSAGDVVVADNLVPDADNTRPLGTNALGWSALYLRNPDDGLTVSLSADGTGETNSGAAVVGVYDEFANSNGGNVQDTLDDLDAAITTGGAGSMWTLAAGVVYPTDATNDFAVGGTTAAASPFGVDESSNTVYVGEGSGGNGTLTFKASDSDSGTVTYSTNDRWEFTGGDVFVGSSSLGAVEAGFVPNGDDLYVAGDIAAQTNVYGDSFVAGDASTTYGNGTLSTSEQNYSINVDVAGADALLHENALSIDGNAGLTVAGTGNGLGGVGPLTVTIGTTANPDNVGIGDANADVAITDGQWSISGSGAAFLTSLSMSGNVEMNNNLVLNIGNAGTDFTAAGGLTLAGALTANGTAQFNSTSEFNSDMDAWFTGTENLRVTSTTGNAGVDAVAIRLANTDTTAANQRALYVTNESDATVSTTESLIEVDNLDSDAVTDGIKVSATGAVTDAIDASAANITNALNVGDNTIIGTTGIIDFTDFDVSADGLITIAPDGGGIGLTIAPSAPMTAGIDFANTNVGVELQLQNDESISNQSNGIIAFSGANGADNTDLTIDLDGTRPVISSDTDALIAFGDNLEVDPNSGNATIDFYASDGDTGALSYDTNDSFYFSGGNILHDALGNLPTAAGGNSTGLTTTDAFTGNSNAALGSISLSALQASTITQAAEGAGTDHDVSGVSGNATSNGASSQSLNLIGVYGTATNQSTNANAIGGFVAGVHASGRMNANGVTVPDVRGLSGTVRNDLGTVTDMFAVRGSVESGVGTVTRGYGGYFANTSAGSTRYGVLGTASGGATGNYAGYFYGSAVHVEENDVPTVASVATGSGDLYVGGQLEVDAKGVTTGTGIVLNSSDLTTGIGLVVQRSTSGTDFTNTSSGLVDFTITDAGSSGTILYLSNSGTGSSLFVNPDAATGNAVSDADGGAVHISNTGNSDYGLTVYSNNGTTSNPLSYFFSDNSSFDDFVVQIQSDAQTADTNNGTALYILQNELNAPNANAIGTQALVIDTLEDFGAANGLLSDAMIIVREDVGGTPDTVFRVDGDGDVWADGTLGAGAADVAELYPSTDELDAGELVAMDPSGTGVLRTTEPYQGTLMGGVSTLPGVLLGFENDGYKIALTGRIPVRVSDENGPIAAGDPITSSSTPGYGMKATEPGMIVGFALEDFTGTGTGTTEVFVNPQFYVGSVIATDGSVTQISDDVELSGSLSVLGSAGSDEGRMTLVTDVTDATDYRLSIENADGTQVAYVSNGGDLALAGRFYPSDRGALQASKYIYYDGSSGMGGDFMRTNASGWATGSYDFAEMFPSADELTAGDVVSFGATNESVALASGATSDRLAGIVSTRPGFLAGENVKGQYPIALAGRVPTKVTAENGTIQIGDPLTASSRPGYAMRATEAGPVVGYALEPYVGGGKDTIVAFVNVSYWDGGSTPDLPGTQNVASTVVVTQNASNLTSLDMNGNVYMTGNDLLGVRRVSGIGERWSIEEDGTFLTSGLLTTVTESYQGEDVETAAVTSPDVQITLVGSGTLENGEAVIRFEDVSPTFNDVTSTTAPIRVIATPNGPVSLYVFERDHDGFGVRQVNGRDSGVTFDWMVSAYRRGYEPEERTDGLDAVEATSEVLPASAASEDEAIVSESATGQDSGDQSSAVSGETPTEASDAADQADQADESSPPSGGDATLIEQPAVDDGAEEDEETEQVVTEETAPPASPEQPPDDSMESAVVEEPAP